MATFDHFINDGFQILIGRFYCPIGLRAVGGGLVSLNPILFHYLVGLSLEMPPVIGYYLMRHPEPADDILP